MTASITIRLATRADEGLALAELLQDCFAEPFHGRTYFKQQPHARLVAFQGDWLIGHVGLDLRVINVGGTLLEIGGVIDLCVAAAMQRQGIGARLLLGIETLAEGRDFMVLMADDDGLYATNGYRRVRPAPTRWLAIDDQTMTSHAVIERDLGDCFMIKPLGCRLWPAGKIDMLGYLF